MLQKQLVAPYPWQHTYWQRFQRQVIQKKRPHALLLSGQRGIGKWDFAKSLAHSILCISPDKGFPCGHCRGCQLNQAQTHPDLLVVTPEPQGRLIKIDQVRQLTDFVNKTSQQGYAKVVLLGPVEALNIHASNALLKSLEEPPGDTLLLLVTHLLSAVVATIRSRCQLILMTAPDRQQGLAWLNTLQFSDDNRNRIPQLLAFAAGAPLTAKAMATSSYSTQIDILVDGLEEVQRGQQSIKVAAQWLEIELTDILEWWLQIVYLLIKQRFSDNEARHQISDIDTLNRLSIYSQHYPLACLFRFNDKLLQLKQQFFMGANLNKQLLLEELLLDWQMLGR
jgi:DNA polymerase III subunit delta'